MGTVAAMAPVAIGVTIQAGLLRTAEEKDI